MPTLTVSPRVLAWARESAGVSVDWAASRVHRPVGELEGWERGEGSPQLTDLRELASLYGRPLSAFLLAEPPDEPPAPPDFRVAAGVEAGTLSHETRLTIRSARRLVRVGSELLVESDARGPRFPLGTARVSDEPWAVAERERERLGIGLSDQTGWPRDEVALSAWRTAVESVGVFVFQLPMSWDELRGFSLSNTDEVPAIVMNSVDFLKSKIFTLFHEYGHLLLGESGICIPEGFLRQGASSHERFCNRFAAELLAPAEYFASGLGETAVSMGAHLSDEELQRVADRLHVSKQVVWTRLYELSVIPEDAFRARWATWRQRRPSKKKSGGPPPYRLQLARRGERFMRTVATAERSGAITRAEALDFAGLKDVHWDVLRSQLDG